MQIYLLLRDLKINFISKTIYYFVSVITTRNVYSDKEIMKTDLDFTQHVRSLLGKINVRFLFKPIILY